MNWMILPLKRYADFQGRATRREFWLFYLLQWLVIFVPMMVLATLARGDGTSDVIATTIAMPLLLSVLALMIPNLAVSVRRLHDHDKSGWFLLLTMVPLVGWIFWIFMMVTPGTPGVNSYGDDPRDLLWFDPKEVF